VIWRHESTPEIAALMDISYIGATSPRFLESESCMSQVESKLCWARLESSPSLAEFESESRCLWLESESQRTEIW